MGGELIVFDQIPGTDRKYANQRRGDDWKKSNKREKDKIDARGVVFELPNIFDMKRNNF